MPSFNVRRLRRPLLHKDSARRINGMQRVIGDGMVGRRCDVNQGSRSGKSDGVHDLQSRSEEPCPEGDRASVRVKKRGNARGAKGGRDVEAEEQRLRPRKAGVVPARAVRARERVPPGPRDVCLPLDARRRRKPRCRITFLSGGPTDVRENRVGPSPGKPDAGDPPVRFGRGSGELDRHSYLIQQLAAASFMHTKQ